MSSDIIKQLREIADTLENSSVNCKEIEITEDENKHLRWCIDTIVHVLKYEGDDLSELSQNRLVEVNAFLNKIHLRNLHVDWYKG